MTRPAVLALTALGLLALAGSWRGAESAPRGDAPILEFTPASLSFGLVPLDTIATRTVRLKNVGTANLVLGELTTDDDRFTVGDRSGPPPPGTIIAAGDSLPVPVSFRPDALGAITGTLFIDSNDPANPTRTVPLSGTGSVGPKLFFAPDSLWETVAAGETADRSLLLRNDGETDLAWGLGVVPADGSAAPARAARANELLGVDILWDRTNGQGPSLAWSTIVGEWESRGATVEERGPAFSLTDSLLARFNVLVSVDNTQSWATSEQNAVRRFVERGGGLLLTGDADASRTPFNNLLSGVGSAIRWKTGQEDIDGVADAVTSGSRISSHPVTEGVNRIYVGIGVKQLDPVEAPAIEVVRDTGDHPILALESIDAGRVLCMSDELFDDSAISSADGSLNADNRALGINAMLWLSGDTWLTVDPSAGTLAAGDSVDVTLTFDPGSLAGGNYDLFARILSNDPLQSEVDVPVRLTVIGAPDISVAPSSLAFGPVPVEESKTESLFVSNSGSEVLNVSAIEASSGVLTALPASFSVAVAAVETVLVEFAPDLIQPYSESLTIRSDALSDSALVVPVGGFGVVNCAQPCVAPSLRPASVEGGNGYEFWLDVLLDDTPDPIQSFGFELTWEDSLLEFLDLTQAGTIAPGFTIDAVENEPGRLTCGGFSSNAIPAGTSGSLAQLLFRVDCGDCVLGLEADFRVQNLIEDLAAVTPCCGVFTVGECPSGNGDVNADSTLSATDALCALRVFLNGGATPPDSACDAPGECEAAAADVNCDEIVTPADALAIHERVLCVADPVPFPCFGDGGSPCSGRRAEGELRWEAGPRQDRAEWRLFGSGVASLGLELDVSGAASAWSVHRGDGAGGWVALESRVVRGRLRIGAYGDVASGELLRLIGPAGGEFVVAEAWGVELAGGPGPSAGRVPAGLHFVGPVPSRGAVEIRWSAARAGGAVDLGVYDVAGRRVRGLAATPPLGTQSTSWDRRDDAGQAVAPGVYFVVLRAGEARFARKVVLLP